MAFIVGSKQLPGYMNKYGAKNHTTLDRTGPASYVQFVTPSTGGDVMNAIDVGLGGFDWVDSAVDTTGQIAAYAVMNLAGSANAVPSIIIVYYSLVTASVGGQSQTIGTQVVAGTNLSTLSWRFQVDGV
jgi:hypothetical protein